MKDLHNSNHSSSMRARVPLYVMGVVLVAIAARSIQLQVFEQDFWHQQGESRFLRQMEIPAHRGVITDRHGEPLAISTPVESLWVNPQNFNADAAQRTRLAALLEISVMELEKRIMQKNKQFVYVKRLLSPETVARIKTLNIDGIGFERGFRRYYPENELTAHVIGFSNVDDRGQAGIEWQYDQTLSGRIGSRKVIKDAYKRVIENVEAFDPPKAGEELQLSLDKHIQFIAYKSLLNAITKHAAASGSVVVLDIKTGEIYAMVNYPSYNPHLRAENPISAMRNRAVTDLFEPGSTIKPFIVATALASGRFDMRSLIDTSPGMMRVGNRSIRDLHDYGTIDLTTILQKSSNVGASKIALAMDGRTTWLALQKLGLGQTTDSGFPGEASGKLRHFVQWTEVDKASIAYGYGLSVTALKLAQAYAALANGGMMPAVSFVKRAGSADREQVISPPIAKIVAGMLETVVSSGGTGQMAQVKGYRMAGKTGTVRKFIQGKYSKEHYLSLFAGFGPVTRPRLAVVVTIDGAEKGGYYGGVVAGPVFAEVMTGALRSLNVMPDDLMSPEAQVAGHFPMKH